MGGSVDGAMVSDFPDRVPEATGPAPSTFGSHDREANVVRQCFGERRPPHVDRADDDTAAANRRDAARAECCLELIQHSSPEGLGASPSERSRRT